MKAIILSAGQGRRLLPHTESRPKCALPVAGRSILEWQIEQAAAAGIREAVVVTGFHADVVDGIVAGVTALRARTLYNPVYAVSDNLVTCWIARHEMDQPFVIVNGDTLFEAEVMRRLLASDPSVPITLATDVKTAYDADDMKIVADGRRLCRVGKKLDLATVNGESIGMMVFRDAGARLFRERLERIVRQTEGLGRWYLSAIDELAQEGHVGICPIHGLRWCEIDDPRDLANAGSVVQSWPSLAGGSLGAGTKTGPA